MKLELRQRRAAGAALAMRWASRCSLATRRGRAAGARAPAPALPARQAARPVPAARRAPGGRGGARPAPVLPRQRDGARAASWRCRPRWSTRCGTSSSCTPAPTTASAAGPSAACCTTRRPRRWRPSRTAPTRTSRACAAPGCGVAATRASTRASRDRLPTLFALDAALAIPGGYRYVPDCRLLGADRGDTHCAGRLRLRLVLRFVVRRGCGGDGGGDGGGCGGGD